eukprot:5251720-Pleurochrysis_carterae.AAC.1
MYARVFLIEFDTRGRVTPLANPLRHARPTFPVGAYALKPWLRSSAFSGSCTRPQPRGSKWAHERRESERGRERGGRVRGTKG